MKTAFFVRHAKSSWKDPSLADVDRPLNKRGLRDAPFMGGILKEEAPAIDALISSPARRAFTTATYFAQAYGLSADNIRVEPSLYFEGVDAMLKLVQSLPEKWEGVAVFSHNPDLTELANRYAPRLVENVPTCAFFRLDHPENAWASFGDDRTRFSSFHFPKQYFPK